MKSIKKSLIITCLISTIIILLLITFCSTAYCKKKTEYLEGELTKIISSEKSCEIIVRTKMGKEVRSTVFTSDDLPICPPHKRIGDLIKIVALANEEAGVKLPQMVFESRADDLIDIAGFPRLDEKTIWQAIFNTGIKHIDWSARKEYENSQPILRFYVETSEEIEVEEVEKQVHQELVHLNSDYSDLEKMLDIRPLRVTLLPAGSFQRYYENKKTSGADLAHLKPPHMNASDTVIQDLIEQANTGET